MEHDKWEFGLVEITYPKLYKKRYLHNTLRLVSEYIIVPVKQCESVFDLPTNIPPFFEPSANENFIGIFSKYIHKYEGQNNDLFNLCRWLNSIIVRENIVSYFPSGACDSIDDLAESVMKPVNCRSPTVNHSIKYNINYAHPEPVYVYTDIIKPNVVGHSYVGLLTTLHFPSAKRYHRFDYPLYKPVEQSYIE